MSAADDESRERPRRDSGSTFVEVVVAVALMTLVIIPIMGAVQSAVRSSSVSREAAEMETLIVNVADRINRAPVICDSLDPYRQYAAAAIRTNGWDPDASGLLGVPNYWHYDPGAGDWRPGATFADGEGVGVRCVQKVQITIRSPKHGIRRTVEVVKSDV